MASYMRSTDVKSRTLAVLGGFNWLRRRSARDPFHACQPAPEEAHGRDLIDNVDAHSWQDAVAANARMYT